MDKRFLGRTGMQVSELCLGTMTFGAETDQSTSHRILDEFVGAGGTLIDTADTYSAGASEEILGHWLKTRSRDDLVVATKVYGEAGPGLPVRGAGRKHIIAAVEASLRRLQTDFIDLYQIHRWDEAVPIEETLEALHDLVKAGKVRYIGASSMFAWQFSKALYTSELRGWSSFVAMQDHYNLLYREEEQEMLPLCEDRGIGVIPWSPLARGRLAREWDATTTRSENDGFGSTLYGRQEDADRAVVDRVGEVAAGRGIPRAQVALAWLLSRPVVTAPIVGATKQQHLDDAVAAVDLRLDDAELARLEEPYVPHARAGF
jgi:aryl-alcohol dehydrogenase (NADP+)